MMFSDTNSTCGALCKPNRSKRSALQSDAIRTGWTPFYMNADDPSGTGDHEHYSYFINNKYDRLTVYDSNGQAYKGCEKKAIHIRERETQIPWWTLSASYTLLFSNITDGRNIYSRNQTNNREDKEKDPTYHTSLKPDYG